MDALKRCYDPEIPVNIVDLGLVYDVKIADEGDVNIKMTLTAQGCPAHAIMAPMIQQEVKTVPGVKNVNVKIVWDPPWTQDRMSEQAKAKLGYGRTEEKKEVSFDPEVFRPVKKGHVVDNPDGTIILINPRNIRYKVNGDIRTLWTLSDGSLSVTELTGQIAEKIGVTPDQIRPQVIEIVRRLSAEELLVEAPAA